MNLSYGWRWYTRNAHFHPGQRLPWLAITEAINQNHKLAWFIKTIATKCALRQRESGELKHNHVGDGEMARSTLFMRTYYLLPKQKFGRTFGTRIPSRKEWAANSVFRNHRSSDFTDESKTWSGYFCVSQVTQNMHSLSSRNLCN